MLGKSESIRPKLGEQTKEIEEFAPLEPRSRKHLFVTNLIDVELWDKATWCGVAFSFAQSEHREDIPIIGLGFRKPKIGKQIFDDLNNSINNDDLKNHIRVSIVRDIDPLNPYKYRMLIGPNEEYLNTMLERAEAENPNYTIDYTNSIFMGISRILELDPRSGENLERFIKKFNETKFFYLTNMKEKLDKDLNKNSDFYTTLLALETPEDFIDFNNAILKKDINIKTLRELNNEYPKSLDHAVLNTFNTRKVKKNPNSGKNQNEKKAVEKRKRKAKEVKKTKKSTRKK